MIFLQDLPKYSAALALNLATNTSSSPLVTNPMSLAFEITLDNVPTRVIKSIDNDILKFIKHYRADAYLLGDKLWD